MSEHDTLRAVLRRVTTGALVEWAGEAADMDDIREAADAVADTLAMLDWRTLLGVPPTPESPSACDRCLRIGCRGGCCRPAPEPPSDEAAMHIDPEPPSGGEVTADELSGVLADHLYPGVTFSAIGNAVAAILARYDVRRKP